MSKYLVVIKTSWFETLARECFILSSFLLFLCFLRVMCEYFIMTSAVSGLQPVVDKQINTNTNTNSYLFV